MISAYRAGDTALHRMPAAAKLFALAVSALGLSLWHPAPAWMPPASLTASAILAGAGSPAEALRAWWRLRWLILVLGGALWALVGVDTAIVNTSRVVTLLLLAEVVTRTTRMADLVEVLGRALRPFRRFGVDPDAVALALSLAIAMVPVIEGFVTAVVDAHRARGLRLGFRSALPLLVMTLRHADDVGDALQARGIGG